MEILWRETFPDKEDDYSAYDGEIYIGRVYLVTTAGVSAYWGWFPVRGGPSGRAEGAATQRAKADTTLGSADARWV